MRHLPKSYQEVKLRWLKLGLPLPIAGFTEKKAITFTFVITLNMAFLTIPGIYECKATICLPRVKSQDSFCLSFIEKHWRIKNESLKVTEDIIVPYIIKEREKLPSPNQSALLIDCNGTGTHNYLVRKRTLNT